MRRTHRDREDHARPVSQQLEGTMFGRLEPIDTIVEQAVAEAIGLKRVSLGFPAPSVAVATSEKAADDLTAGPRASTLRKLALAYVERKGRYGATPDEFCAVIDVPHDTGASRFSELLARNLIVRCDGKVGNPPERRRPTRRGGQAYVHVSPLEAERLRQQERDRPCP